MDINPRDKEPSSYNGNQRAEGLQDLCHTTLIEIDTSANYLDRQTIAISGRPNASAQRGNECDSEV